MKEGLLKEIRFITSRSSGPGGQHVNKTESRVTLIWNLENSTAISEDQRKLLRERLKKRMNTEGEFQLSSQGSRSQQVNKEEVTERFLALIERLSRPPKRRIATKPSRASKERRLKQKKGRSEIKRSRQRPSDE